MPICLSLPISAGTKIVKTKVETTSFEQHRFNSIGDVKCARKKIEDDVSLDNEAKRESILDLYLCSLNLLHTASDYSVLLFDEKNETKAIDLFFERHIEEFFKTKPQLRQVIEIIDLQQYYATSSKIIDAAFSLVRTPEDFLILAEHCNPKERSTKELFHHVFMKNIEKFMDTCPSVIDVIRLQEILLQTQFDKQVTTLALIELKQKCKLIFEGRDLRLLLESGCLNSCEEYRNELQKLKEDAHINTMNLGPVTQDDIQYALESMNAIKKSGFHNFCNYALKQVPTAKIFNRWIKIIRDINGAGYAYQLIDENIYLALNPKFTDVVILFNIFGNISIINMIIKVIDHDLSTEDFFGLFPCNKKFSPELGRTLIKILKKSLGKIDKKNFSIDDVIKLQKVVWFYSVDEEKAINLIIAIKDHFYSEFTGIDLIRLLDSGVSNPSLRYRDQLTLFRQLKSGESLLGSLQEIDTRQKPLKKAIEAPEIRR
jgi:hypothetical protein